MLPPNVLLDPLIVGWLQEDIGRGDRTTLGLGAAMGDRAGKAVWVAKAQGVIAGLPVAQRVFQKLCDQTNLNPSVTEGTVCEAGTVIAKIEGPLWSLLTGERVALNVAMHLSGIATLTQRYVDKIADMPAQLVDTRKTTPGLRSLEKYATWIGGAVNHRMGLDDGVMIKDNHIAAAGGIQAAIERIRVQLPYPLSIEVETENLDMVRNALNADADIIMLDNMRPALMQEAVALIRQTHSHVKIEASGNVTLETIRSVAATGVDYISTSAPITQASWLDLSMRLQE
ncbi:MAG: carboxylating nicotinate-nucleotide diphosphorylase [Leptolyngbyaceae cyanobacterium]